MNFKSIAGTAAIVTALSFGFVSQAEAANEFTDIHNSSKYYDSFSDLYHQQILSGYTSPEYGDPVEMRPFATVTRAQAAKSLSVAIGLGDSTQDANQFGDVPESYWGHDYITLLNAAGVTDGKSVDRFAPFDFITRAEAAKMIVDGFDIPIDTSYSSNWFTDVDPDGWSADYISTIFTSGITSGTSDYQFSPAQPITRAELAIFLNRALDRMHPEELNDRQLTNFAKERVSKVSWEMTRGHFNDTGKLPYRAIEREIRGVATGEMLSAIKEMYADICTGCDVQRFDLGINADLEFESINKSNSEVRFKVGGSGYPNYLPSISDVTLVYDEANKKWKLSGLVSTNNGVNYDLTRESSLNFVEKEFRKQMASDKDNYVNFELADTAAGGNILKIHGTGSKTKYIYEFNRNTTETNIIKVPIK